LVADLPLHSDDMAEHGGSAESKVAEVIQRVVERMYSETQEIRTLVSGKSGNEAGRSIDTVANTGQYL
jgi:hypothetical protein